MPMLELTIVGRKSGEARATMLSLPLQFGESVLVVVSRGGVALDLGARVVHGVEIAEYVVESAGGGGRGIRWCGGGVGADGGEIASGSRWAVANVSQTSGIWIIFLPSGCGTLYVMATCEDASGDASADARAWATSRQSAAARNSVHDRAWVVASWRPADYSNPHAVDLE